MSRAFLLLLSIAAARGLALAGVRSSLAVRPALTPLGVSRLASHGFTACLRAVSAHFWRVLLVMTAGAVGLQALMRDGARAKHASHPPQSLFRCRVGDAMAAQTVCARTRRRLLWSMNARARARAAKRHVAYVRMAEEATEAGKPGRIARVCVHGQPIGRELAAFRRP